MKTKKHDFIEIGYVARIKENNQIVDLTDEKTAKENNIYNSNFKYKPLILCIGQGHVIQGLDEDLENKEIDKEYEVEVKPEKAFGKKDPKLLKLVNTNKLRKQNINPFPGLHIALDNYLGIIKSVTGGRTLVDFNHPLAGKNIIYKYKINKIVTDDKEKLNALLELSYGKEIKFTLENNIVEIEAPKIKEIGDKIMELIPSIKEIRYKTDVKG